MKRILLALTFFITTFGSISFTNASSIPNDNLNNPSQVILTAPTPGPGDLFLGWRGIVRKEDAVKFQNKPHASLGGELGAVVYLADGTELATFFATNKGYICQVYASGKKWNEIQKYWVSPQDLVDYKNRMHELHPGAVLFASHDATPTMSDSEPWQMGIRPGSISSIGLTAKCQLVDLKAPHKKINYHKRVDWNIHGDPDRPKHLNMTI